MRMGVSSSEWDNAWIEDTIHWVYIHVCICIFIWPYKASSDVDDDDDDGCSFFYSLLVPFHLPFISFLGFVRVCEGICGKHIRWGDHFHPVWSVNSLRRALSKDLVVNLCACAVAWKIQSGVIQSTICQKLSFMFRSFFGNKRENVSQTGTGIGNLNRMTT